MGSCRRGVAARTFRTLTAVLRFGQEPQNALPRATRSARAAARQDRVALDRSHRLLATVDAERQAMAARERRDSLIQSGTISRGDTALGPAPGISRSRVFRDGRRQHRRIARDHPEILSLAYAVGQ